MPTATPAPGLDQEESGGGGGSARASRSWRWACLAAAVFLVAHLPFLPPAPDDIDAINFALGVRDYDPALHQPHPPGYPLYIVLAKASTAIADAVRPAGGSFHGDARDNTLVGLWIWSVVFGAIGVLASFVLFHYVDPAGPSDAAAGARPASTRPAGATPGSGLAATLLLACSPLYWFTAARPLSDTVGLAAGTVAQALLVAAMALQRRHDPACPRPAGGRRTLVVGAFVATFAIGLRSQVMWLSLPLLSMALVDRWRRSGFRTILPAVAAAVAGGVAWGIPLLVATGGLERYLVALADQGGEDFSGVDMLWTHMGARRAWLGVYQSFVLPWSSWMLAGSVLACAGLGLADVVRRSKGAAWLLAVLGLPYGIFHLLFHETVTVRYALPLLPPVCYLAVRGAGLLGRRVAWALVVVGVTASLGIGMVALESYREVPSPVFRALADMRAAAAKEEARPALAMHRRIAAEGRRALMWGAEDEPFWSRRIPAVRHAEWATAERVLVDDPGVPLWFLAEPSRVSELRMRDFPLIDPAGRRLVHAYRWPFDSEGLVGGARPNEVDWFEIRNPGWILGDGWALTPETAGVSAARRVSLATSPIRGLVRRREGAAVLLVGGRHLGPPGSPPVRLQVDIDESAVASFEVRRGDQFFLVEVPLPAGRLSGPGPFARLAVSAQRASGPGPTPDVAVEQFDLQDRGRVVSGLDRGWYEHEYDASRGLAWHWMGERATVLVYPGDARAVDVRVVAESPRKYFDAPSEITLAVGTRALARVTANPSVSRVAARAMPWLRVELSARVPRDLLEAAGRRVTLTASQSFVPGAGAPGADQRRLALRVYEVRVTPAS